MRRKVRHIHRPGDDAKDQADAATDEEDPCFAGRAALSDDRGDHRGFVPVGRGRVGEIRQLL